MLVLLRLGRAFELAGSGTAEVYCSAEEYE